MSTKKEDEIAAALDDIAAQRETRLKDLANATAAYKKCRQMRGADAYKRAWYFEEKMKTHKEELDRLDRERADLELRRSPAQPD